MMIVRIATALLVPAILQYAGCAVAPDISRTGDSGPRAGAHAVPLADEYMAAYFDRYPEQATYYGIASRRHDALTDLSPAALAAWQAFEDQLLARLNEAGNHPQVSDTGWAAVSMLREILEASIAMRVCHAELMPVSQIDGWQVTLPYIIGIQPVETAELRHQSLLRIRALEAHIDSVIVAARAGLDAGYSTPRHVVPLVLEQLKPLLADTSPLMSPALRSDDEAFASEYREVMAQRVLPAIHRYIAFLDREYKPAARTSIAVAALPDGKACYRAAIRFYAGVAGEPSAVHELGLAQIAKIQAEMAAISTRSFAAMPVPDLIAMLTGDPVYAFADRDAVVAYAEAAFQRARAAMPDWFGILPTSAVVIEPYPAYREGSGTGEYNSPSEDGNRPGVFYIATKNPRSRPRAGQESLTFHETIPGHHLQGAIAVERGARIHPIQRYTYSSGYGEGWALYAERLADEMGLYGSDLDRMGMLGDQGARAARLVIDTGIHTFGWSRDRAVGYMRAHTTWPDEDIEAEIDRYIVWPGQATSYMLGMLEILRLRAQAEAALGDRFSIQAFHDLLLEDGNVVLPMLKIKVQDYISRQGSTH